MCVVSVQVTTRTPLGYWGMPEDLMGACTFLASPASNYVNGHLLMVTTAPANPRPRHSRDCAPAAAHHPPASFDRCCPLSPFLLVSSSPSVSRQPLPLLPACPRIIPASLDYILLRAISRSHPTRGFVFGFIRSTAGCRRRAATRCWPEQRVTWWARPSSWHATRGCSRQLRQTAAAAAQAETATSGSGT